MKKGELTELERRLIDVNPYEDFVDEVMGAIETEDEEKQIIDFLKAHEDDELVPADVYEELISVTNGRFKKVFPPSRNAKIAYANEQSNANLERLMKSLETQPCVITLVEWNLTEEEERRFAEAELEDPVKINTEYIPALFENEEEDFVFVPIYTSQLEVASSMLEQYALFSGRTFQEMAIFACRITKILNRNVKIVLDKDGADCVEFTKPMYERYYDENLEEDIENEN